MPEFAPRFLRLCMPFLVAGASLLAAPSAAFAEEELSPAEHVSRANQALANGEFEAALEGYRQAEVLVPDAPALIYDQAVAYYRMRDFAKARELFSRALTTRDLELEARAKFNLGNCQYSEALEKMANLQEAIDQLRTAIEYYLDVLEIAPDDVDARTNIETAQLLIKDLLDKLKNQQEQNPTSQPSECEQQEQQDGEQEQQEQQGDEQQEQDEQGEQQAGDEQQEQDEQGEQQAGDEQQEQDEQGEQRAGEQEERKLTEEEAQRLLQGIRDKEQQRRDERAQRRRIGRARVTKDW